jgi:hypothetical protein
MHLIFRCTRTCWRTKHVLGVRPMVQAAMDADGRCPYAQLRKLRPSRRPTAEHDEDIPMLCRLSVSLSCRSKPPPGSRLADCSVCSLRSTRGGTDSRRATRYRCADAVQTALLRMRNLREASGPQCRLDRFPAGERPSLATPASQCEAFNRSPRHAGLRWVTS